MKKFITLIIAIAMIATLATGCGVNAPAEDVFNKYDKDTTVTETEKDSADKSDDKDADKSDSDKKDESDKKDDNKSEADKKDDDKVADNADKDNGSKPSGSGSTNSNAGSKPSGGNSNTGSKPSGGSNNSNTGSKPSGGNTNQSKPVEPQKPVHSHSYAVVSQTGATCTAAGVTTYKCSCGHSYTEQNGSALGHAWQQQYNEWDEVVHHPGTVVEKLVCSHGNTFSSADEHYAHCDALMEQGLDGCGVSSYPEEVGAWDETVHHSDPCGQKCTRCGANG
jgi:hypothetical protein